MAKAARFRVYKPTATTLRATPTVAMVSRLTSGTYSVIFNNGWTIGVHGGASVATGRWYSMKPANQYPETTIEHGHPRPEPAVRKAMQYRALAHVLADKSPKFFVDFMDDVIAEVPRG